MNPPLSGSPPRELHRILPADWPWLFAYPAYQIIGTIRHEASHALAVILEGGRVTEFVFWPTRETRFYWGYLRWSGQTDWLVSAAPYFADLATFAVFYFICTRVKIKRHWLWVNLYAIGLVSPLVNSAYRYVSNFFRTGDLTSVTQAVPSAAVHAYFILTAVLYVAALVRIQRSGSGGAAPPSVAPPA